MKKLTKIFLVLFLLIIIKNEKCTNLKDTCKSCTNDGFVWCTLNNNCVDHDYECPKPNNITWISNNDIKCGDHIIKSSSFCPKYQVQFLKSIFNIEAVKIF
jgi:hypothetical protein